MTEQRFQAASKEEAVQAAIEAARRDSIGYRDIRWYNDLINAESIRYDNT